MKNRKNPINDATVRSYYDILERYKAGKANLESRIIDILRDADNGEDA